MIFVSDTSPIMNLAAIGRLDLLERIYGHVHIPQAVFNELTSIDRDEIPNLLLDSFPFIETARVTDIALVSQLVDSLHMGEAEAITLAVERHAGILLIDERDGRKAATSHGVKVRGLLGVLTEAKQRNIIGQIQPLMDELLNVGFWIGAPLYSRVLEYAGE